MYSIFLLETQHMYIAAGSGGEEGSSNHEVSGRRNHAGGDDIIDGPYSGAVLGTIRLFNIAIEHGYLSWIYPLNMVIFHSYVKLTEGIQHSHRKSTLYGGFYDFNVNIIYKWAVFHGCFM